MIQSPIFGVRKEYERWTTFRPCRNIRWKQHEVRPAQKEVAPAKVESRCASPQTNTPAPKTT